MGPEEAKRRLLLLRRPLEDFTLVFSGKKSRRINGTYYPARKEIAINNLNFVGEDNELEENLLMSTAIHEFAHHLVDTELDQPRSRCHTALFWSVFDDLAEEAERTGVCRLRPDEQTLELAEAAAEISRRMAALQRELGAALKLAAESCKRQGISPDDLFRRKIKLTMASCKRAMEADSLGAPESVNMDQQAALLAERSPERRRAMAEGIREGKTVDQIKRPADRPASEPDDFGRLSGERDRLERSIMRLQIRLAGVQARLEELSQGPPGEEQRGAAP
jgi:hypothetical protein